jgi:hypothetical protein
MGWGEAIAAVISAASAASANKGANGARVSWDEAMNRAGNELSGTYDNTLNKTLGSLKNNQIARGVYGQLPSDVLTRSTVADIEGQKSSAISQLANAIHSNAQTRADALRQQAQSALTNAGSSFANLLNNSDVTLDWKKLLGKTNSEDPLNSLTTPKSGGTTFYKSAF